MNKMGTGMLITWNTEADFVKSRQWVASRWEGSALYSLFFLPLVLLSLLLSIVGRDSPFFMSLLLFSSFHPLGVSFSLPQFLGVVSMALTINKFEIPKQFADIQEEQKKSETCFRNLCEKQLWALIILVFFFFFKQHMAIGFVLHYLDLCNLGQLLDSQLLLLHFFFFFF